MGKLILVRHGESEWNLVGKWTGWTDVSLTEKGRKEAQRAGKAINNIPLNQGFCSVLVRAKETLAEALRVIGKEDLPVIYDAALNERNYGIYTGKNKWEVKEEVGNEKFMAIRRGYDTLIPEGENLKQVCERVHPYYMKTILPLLKKRENVIVSAHGNSLRALMKLLDSIPDDEVYKLEMKTGEVILYEINDKGEVISKELMTTNEDAGLQ